MRLLRRRRQTPPAEPPAVPPVEPPAPAPTAASPRRPGRVRRVLRAPSRLPALLGRGWLHLESALLRWSEPSGLPADPRVRLRLTVAVWTIAVGLTAIAFGTSFTVYDVDQLGWGVMPFVGALAGLPFGLVLTRPTLGLLISEVSAFVLGLVLPMANPEPDPWRWLVVHSLVMFALLLAVSIREPLRRVVGAWAASVLLFGWGTQSGLQTGWMIGVTIIVVLGLLIGRLAKTNRALSVQTEMSTVERERRLVLEERARIARDLHDIVAHHMSLVVVQAETAGFRHPELPDVARDELESIAGSARAALSETRALLAVLRSADDGADHAPQPGLDQLADLVDGARRAGQSIGLELPQAQALRPLRPGTSLAAYRIVQESLANAARHAPGAAVRIEVQASADDLQLTVVNGAPAHPPEPGDGEPGHGIIGMRERATAEGGSLDAAPRADGGFAVRAVLPWGAS